MFVAWGDDCWQAELLYECPPKYIHIVLTCDGVH